MTSHGDDVSVGGQTIGLHRWNEAASTAGCGRCSTLHRGARWRARPGAGDGGTRFPSHHRPGSVRQQARLPISLLSGRPDSNRWPS